MGRAIQLRKLARGRGPDDDWYCGEISSTCSAAEQFYFIIEPEYDGDSRAANGFWEEITSEKADPEDEYVFGFADGALEVWSQIEPQI
jgi:hypothetical protein